MKILEVRKNGQLMCVCNGESTFPSKEEMKHMKAAGYKFYQDGKLYKPEENKK
jgi:hypothetical protein